MYASFDDIINAACARKTKRTIAIAAAEDDKMVHVAQAVTERGLCGVIMVGNAEGMKKLMREAGLPEDSVELVDEQDPARLGDRGEAGARRARGHPGQGQDEHERLSARRPGQGLRPALFPASSTFSPATTSRARRSSFSSRTAA